MESNVKKPRKGMSGRKMEAVRGPCFLMFSEKKMRKTAVTGVRQGQEEYLYKRKNSLRNSNRKRK